MLASFGMHTGGKEYRRLVGTFERIFGLHFLLHHSREGDKHFCVTAERQGRCSSVLTGSLERQFRDAGG